MEIPNKIIAKCLLCLDEANLTSNSIITPEESQSDDEVSLDTSSVLEQHLQLIFLLKNILDHPKKKLVKYLKIQSRGPESWFVLCDGCSNQVVHLRKLYAKLQKITHQYLEAKRKVREKIKLSFSTSTEQDERIIGGQTMVWKECRNFVRKLDVPEAPLSYLSTSKKSLKTKRSHIKVKPCLPIKRLKLEVEDDSEATYFYSNSRPPEVDPLEDEELAVIKEESDDSCQEDYKLTATITKKDNDCSKKCSEPRRASTLSDNIDLGEDNSSIGIDGDADFDQEGDGYNEEDDDDETQPKVKSDTQKKDYTCNLCKNYKPMTINGFVCHIHRYHLVSYKCVKCPRGFKYLGGDAEEGAISSHWNLYHKSIKNDYPTKSMKVEKVHPELPFIPWHCPKCREVFEDEATRDQHLISCEVGEDFNLEKNVKCSICSGCYFSSVDLQLHGLLEHPEVANIEKSFKCDQCSLVFTTELMLRSHRMAVHRLDPYQCDQCGKEYFKKRPFDHHIKVAHTPKEKKEFPCVVEGCGKVYLTLRSLQLHSESHSSGWKPHRCEICGTEYQFRKGLIQHQLLSHNDDTRNPSSTGKFYIECPKCGLRRRTQAQLDLHLKRCTGKPCSARGGEHSCLPCNFRFFSLEDLQAHNLFKHQGTSATSAPTGESVMNVNVEQNTEAIPGPVTENVTKPSRKKPRKRCVCKICGREDFEKRNIARHVANVHEKSYLFYCQICGIGSDAPKRIKKHLAGAHHIGDYKCEWENCTTVCASPEDLDRHVRAKHKNERPNVCTICGKGFFSIFHLRDHVASVHATEKLFSCDLCGKSFPTLGYLGNHKRTYHKDKK